MPTWSNSERWKVEMMQVLHARLLLKRKMSFSFTFSFFSLSHLL